MKLELKDGKAVAALVIALLLGVLVGSFIGWAVQSARVRNLEDRLDAAETGLAEIAEAQEETTAMPESQPPEEEPAEPGTPPEAVTERQPALVTSTRPAGETDYLTLDYIQFLTGEEAVEAATAHGDESPPPNGYYIVNDNPRLREFPIQAGIAVHVVVNDDGTSDPEGHSMPLDDWLATINGPDAPAFLANFYWVTITDGTITAIEQQYLP